MNKKVVLAFSALMTLSVAATASAQTLYSPSEYPTAQGQYLQPPNSYQSPDAVPVSPPAPISAPPAYVAPAAPVALPAATPPAYAQPVAAPVQATPQPAPQQLGAVPVPRAVAPVSYDSMPSYDYNKNMDPAHPGYKTPIAHDPKPGGAKTGIDVGTVGGFEIGVDLSEYRYQEFDPSGQELIRVIGPTIGLRGAYTKAYQSGWFWGGDLRAAYGDYNYTGGDQIISGPNAGQTIPSKQKDISNWMFDIRALGGHDFIFRDSFWGMTDVDLSPYAGLGFRYLYYDNESSDSNGVPGYERYSHYLYLPVGISPRFKINENSRLSLNFEYDLLLYGWQISALGDTDPGETDLTNTQKTGYGLRGSVMYERHSWSAGPFFEFWDIGQSTTDCNNATCGFEPHNQTFDFGVQGKYRF